MHVCASMIACEGSCICSMRFQFAKTACLSIAQWMLVVTAVLLACSMINDSSC